MSFSMKYIFLRKRLTILLFIFLYIFFLHYYVLDDCCVLLTCVSFMTMLLKL